MTPINRTINYRIIKSILKIRVRWNQRKHELTVSTGYIIDKFTSSGKSAWDGTACKNGTFHGPARVPAAVINERLRQLKAAINHVFLEFEMDDVMPTAEMVRAVLFPDSNNLHALSLEAAMHTFIREESLRREWAFNTIKSVRQCMHLALAYAPKATIDDIQPEWLDKFVVFQQHHQLAKGACAPVVINKGGSNVTVTKNCRVFKWFLRWAAAKRLISAETVEGWRPQPKVIRKPVIYLTWEELKRMWQLELTDPKRIRARDIFCFCCMTGLRYSDAMALRHSAIRNNRIEIVTQKTASLLSIDLNKHARSLIEKYRYLPDDRVLPHMDPAYLNLELKQVAKEAGIDEMVTISQMYGGTRKVKTVPKWQVLSSHAARRTFVVNLLSLGVSPTVVMQWTGHSDYSAMRPYIDIADQTKRRSMDLLDNIEL